MQGSVVRIPRPDVGVAISHGLPEVGAETNQLKVLDQQTTARSNTLTLSGMGGETYALLLRENAAGLKFHADGATLGALNHGVRSMTVTFPKAARYTTKAVTFSW